MSAPVSMPHVMPTYGRLPRTGSYPFVSSLDHLGPLARSASVNHVVSRHAATAKDNGNVHRQHIRDRDSARARGACVRHAG